MNQVRLIDALRRFWWVAAAFLVAGVVVGALPAPETPTESVTRWSASHTILVQNPTNPSQYANPVSFNQLSLFTRTGEVPKRVADLIDYNGAPAQLAGQVSVTLEQQSGSMRISTTQNDPDRAVQLADAFADQLILFLAEQQDATREARLTTTLERLTGLEAEIAEVEPLALADPNDAVVNARLEALQRQYSVIYEQYDSLRADTGGTLQLTTLERAQPVAVTERGLGAPRTRTSRGLLGAVAGGALGIGVAILLARSDRTIRSRDQAEQIVGVPVHAAIPAVSGHDPNEVAVRASRHDPLSDSYRTLRSVISFVETDSDRGRAPITLVVSPGPGDGKTSVTANLASAFAEAGHRTLAVNTDFRRPTLSKRFGVVHDDVAAPLDELARMPASEIATPVPEFGLDVIDFATRRHQHNPGDLARLTARMLPQAAQEYDHVVVDTSPVGATAEVLEFVPLADVIVIVVTLGHSSAHSLRRAIDTLRRLSTGQILMAVVGGRSGESGYYYYYYYSSTPATDGPDKHRKGLSRLLPKRRAKSGEEPAGFSVVPPGDPFDLPSTQSIDTESFETGSIETGAGDGDLLTDWTEWEPAKADELIDPTPLDMTRPLFGLDELDEFDDRFDNRRDEPRQ